MAYNYRDCIGAFVKADNQIANVLQYRYKYSFLSVYVLRRPFWYTLPVIEVRLLEEFLQCL